MNDPQRKKHQQDRQREIDRVEKRNRKLQKALDRVARTVEGLSLDGTSKAPKTEGWWSVEKQDDGSWWVMGKDPWPMYDDKVLVAVFETEKDARHAADLHNQYIGQ
jgi:hypothetical protein